MQFDSVLLVLIPAVLTDGVKALRGLPKRLLENRRLLRRGHQDYSDGALHTHVLAHYVGVCQDNADLIYLGNSSPA